MGKAGYTSGIAAFTKLCLMVQQTHVSINNVLKFKLCQSVSHSFIRLSATSVSYLVSKSVCHNYVGKIRRCALDKNTLNSVFICLVSIGHFPNNYSFCLFLWL